MPWPKTGAIQYHAQLGLLDKVCAIKGLIVSYDSDIELLDLLNGRAGSRSLSTVPRSMKSKSIEVYVETLPFNL